MDRISKITEPVAHLDNERLIGDLLRSILTPNEAREDDPVQSVGHGLVDLAGNEMCFAGRSSTTSSARSSCSTPSTLCEASHRSRRRPAATGGDYSRSSCDVSGLATPQNPLWLSG